MVFITSQGRVPDCLSLSTLVGMEALEVLARHAGGPRSLLSLLQAGGYSSTRLEGSVSQAFLDPEAVTDLWGSTRPHANAACAVLSHVSDPTVLAEIYALDTRTSVRTTILRNEFCTNDLVIDATLSRNKSVKRCALAMLEARVEKMSASAALDLLRYSARIELARMVAGRSDLTSNDLLRFLSENTRFHDDDRSINAAALIVKRHGVANYDEDVLVLLCSDPKAAQTVMSLLPSGHNFPHSVLAELNKMTNAPAALVEPLLFFQTEDETYYENLITFLRRQGVDPSQTRLDQNSKCPWRLLSQSSLRPRTWGVAARAIAEVFEDDPVLWTLAAGLMPEFSGTVDELLECLESLYPEAVRSESL